jgi:predicted RNA-binding protein
MAFVPLDLLRISASIDKIRYYTILKELKEISKRLTRIERNITKIEKEMKKP